MNVREMLQEVLFPRVMILGVSKDSGSASSQLRPSPSLSGLADGSEWDSLDLAGVVAE